MIKLATRDFGQIQVEEQQVITFVQPLFGFEDYTRYVLLTDSEGGESIAWLQSAEEPQLCFILADPTGLHPAFAPSVPAEVEPRLGEGEIVCWVIATVGQDVRRTTVNLKSPVLINRDTGRAAQVILDQDYPVRFPLVKGAAATC